MLFVDLVLSLILEAVQRTMHCNSWIFRASMKQCYSALESNKENLPRQILNVSFFSGYNGINSHKTNFRVHRAITGRKEIRAASL